MEYRRELMTSTAKISWSGYLDALRSLPRRRETLQVMIRVAEGLRDHRQPPERVADLQLFGHAHAAVELDRLLADVARGVRDLDLRRGDDAPALGRLGRVHLDARQTRDRLGLLVADQDVDHPVLQRLERADRHAELPARLEIVERRVVRVL